MISRSTRPRRVLISGGLASGGVQTHVATLCESFSPNEVQFTLFGAKVGWSGTSIDAIRKRGIKVVASSFQSQLLQKIDSVLRAFFMRRNQFDVLLLLGSSGLHERLLPAVKPDGFAIYNEINHYPRADLMPVVRKMDGLIAISNFTENRLKEGFPGMPVRSLCLFPSYSDKQVTNNASSKRERELQLVFIGRLVEEQKRPHLLVERWKEFATSAPVAPARLDIYGFGDEPLVQRMKASIREQGLTDIIRLHGTYEHGALDEILANADLVLNPSAYEGLGLVLLEAMQRGVPVVATEAGGSAELGDGNLDSVFTPGNDWKSFCDGVREMARRLRADEIDHVRLRRWVDDRYGKTQLLDQWRNVLTNPREFFGTNA